MRRKEAVVLPRGLIKEALVCRFVYYFKGVGCRLSIIESASPLLRYFIQLLGRYTLYRLAERAAKGSIRNCVKYLQDISFIPISVLYHVWNKSRYDETKLREFDM